MKMFNEKAFLVILLNFLLVLCNVEGFSYETLIPDDQFKVHAVSWFHQLWRLNRFNVINVGMREHGMNNTVVATQHIYDNDGDLKEINTLELNVPRSMIQSTNEEKSQKILEDTSEHGLQYYTQKLVKVLETHENLSYTGLPMQLTFEEYNEFENGKVDNYVFVAHNLIGGCIKGRCFINQTIKTKHREVVKDYVIKSTKNAEDALPIIFLNYFDDVKLVKNRSMITNEEWIYGEQLITVTKMKVHDHQIIATATTAFTKAMFESPETVKEDLIADMKDKFPNYFWFLVTGDIKKSFDSDDYIYITMKNDHFQLSEEEEPTLTLFGVKIKTTN